MVQAGLVDGGVPSTEGEDTGPGNSAEARESDSTYPFSRLSYLRKRMSIEAKRRSPSRVCLIEEILEVDDVSVGPVRDRPRLAARPVPTSRALSFQLGGSFDLVSSSRDSEFEVRWELVLREDVLRQRGVPCWINRRCGGGECHRSIAGHSCGEWRLLHISDLEYG